MIKVQIVKSQGETIPLWFAQGYHDSRPARAGSTVTEILHGARKGTALSLFQWFNRREKYHENQQELTPVHR